MQGTGSPPDAYVGQNGQVSTPHHPNRGQVPNRPMMPLSSSVAGIRTLPPIYQAYRYGGSSQMVVTTPQEQKAPPLSEFERLRLTHQQQGQVGNPSLSSPGNPLHTGNGMIAVNGPNSMNLLAQMKFPPVGANPISSGGSLGQVVPHPLQQMNPPHGQRASFSGTVQSQQPFVQQFGMQQNFLNQHQYIHPSVPHAQQAPLQQLLRSSSLQPHLMHQQSTSQSQQQQQLVRPPSDASAINCDVMISDVSKTPSVRPVPQHFAPQSIQGFPQPGLKISPNTMAVPALSQSQSSLNQLNIRQVGPPSVSTGLRGPQFVHQDTQQPSASPSTSTNLQRQSRVPSPRSNSGAHTAGPMVSGNLDIAPHPLSCSSAPSSNLPSQPLQQQITQRILSDARYPITHLQQIQPPMPSPAMRPPMVPHQVIPPQRQPQVRIPSQLEHLHRQQQLSLMARGVAPQQSALLPAPVPGETTLGVAPGKEGLRLMSTGVHLSLGTALKTEGTFNSRDFGYTELLLRGLAPGDRLPQVEDQLVEILTGLSGMKPQIGIWKSECWRAVVNQEELAASSGKLIQSQSMFNQELWVRRYIQPQALKDFISKKTNKIYCACYLFHHNAGTPESHLMILLQKHFKDEGMSEDLFPGQLVVEVIGRVEEDNLIEPLSRRIIDFCRHLQP